MTVQWGDIKAEYETLSGGYRERIVALFQRYEGQETDEVVRGKAVKVTANSFAKRMGISQRTFAKWVSEFGLANMAKPVDAEPEPPTTCINDGVPPAKGFVQEVNDRLRQCIPLLPQLSTDTKQQIAEDIAATRQLLDEIETALKANQP